MYEQVEEFIMFAGALGLCLVVSFLPDLFQLA
jgi:hypothetical protein